MPDGLTKLCKKCGLYKPATRFFFSKNSSRCSGLQSTCKECNRQYYIAKHKNGNDAIRYDMNKTKVVKPRQRFKLGEDPETRTCLCCKVEFPNDPNLLHVLRGRTQNKCKPCFNQHKVNERIRSKEVLDRTREIKREYQKRVRSDPIEGMKGRLRKRIRTMMVLKGFTKQSTLENIVGIDWAGLKAHIEKQFKDGMSWENMNLWHIDHKIPLATAESVEDVVRLNHYTNLQPLWAIENLKKGDKIL